MPRDPERQKARQISGKEAERLVRPVLERDPKLKGWKFEFVLDHATGGLDVSLHPPRSCEKHPHDKGCRMPLYMEVKSVEKLFEHVPDSPWPHNRTSRYVLKKEENPHCYVLVTKDDIADRVSIDFVANTGELSEWKAKQRGVSQKLPVRALPRLRLRPCPYVTQHKLVTIV